MSKGTKKALTSGQAARIRWEIKSGTKNVSVKRRAALADYDAGVRAEEAKPDDAQPDDTAKDAASADRPAPEPEASPEPDLPPNVEPPPRVADAPVNVAGAKAGTTGDWRDKHRAAINFAGDGRQMLCEAVGKSLTAALGALFDETSKVTSPKVPDPRLFESMFILALDDVLPDRAKLTPKVGAAVVMTATLVERGWHAKKIAEYLKTSPDHQAWLKKQAERERAEADLQREAVARANGEAHAQASNPGAVKEAAPQYAEPPLPPEQTNGVHAPPPQRAAPAAQKADPDDVLC